MEKPHKIWWCALDLKHNSSYDEIKGRKVIAQGVPALGSLTDICQSDYDKDSFLTIIGRLGDEKHTGPEDIWWWENHKNVIHTLPSSMWNLINLKVGDLVVGIEGTTVRGICQLAIDARTSYEFQDGFNYAHAVGFPVNWIDWNESILGLPPITPGRGVFGIKGLQKQHSYVLKCWQKYLENQHSA